MMPNQDEVEGKFQQVKGKVKEGVAHVTGDQRLADEGADDQAAGKVQETVGTAKRKVGEAVESLGEQIKK
jgi:uncharacterized protein YjbJ (UPF0337 family)